MPELFPSLMQNLDRPGGVLSDGQQQLAIARALILLRHPWRGIRWRDSQRRDSFAPPGG